MGTFVILEDVLSDYDVLVNEQTRFISSKHHRISVYLISMINL